jgi:hypothetical protein
MAEKTLLLGVDFTSQGVENAKIQLNEKQVRSSNKLKEETTAAVVSLFRFAVLH